MSPTTSIKNVFASAGLANWIDRGIVVAVMLASGVALSLNVADPDLWGHVQYGRDALARGLPATTTYSYIAEGYPWINHEILAEYALALGADHLGGPGLLVIKCLLGMAIVGLMLRRALKQGAGLIAACAAALLVAVCLGSHWSLRPQLFSYVSFTVLLALLSYCFEGWEGRWQLWRRSVASPDPEASSSPLEYSHSRLRFLWLTPLLMMIWTNTHGGFLAGLAIYIAYLGLRSVEAIVRKGRAADGLVVRFALMALAAVVATLVNPYGPYFHTWLYDDLKVPRPEIVEWRSPDFTDAQTIPLVLVMIGWLGCLVLSRRSRDFTQQVIMGLILWQSLMHSRHVAFLAIAFGWWMPVHLDSVLRRFGIGAAGNKEEAVSSNSGMKPKETFGGGLSPRMQPVFAGMLVLAILICGGRLATRVTKLCVERDKYPVSAFEYIARERLSGKMVCTFNWAQYALAAFGPREPGQPGILTQIDGRCRTSFSQEMLDIHFDLILGDLDASQRFRGPDSGPFNPLRSLEEGRPDLVLLSRLQEPGVAVMNSQRDRWIVLYQDELAQLWGRTSKYGDPRSAYFIPLSRRQISNDPQRGIVSWPATPKYEPASAQPIRSVAIDNPPADPPGTHL